MPIQFAIAILFAASAVAHEIGTTRVAASMTGPAYEIEIATDGAALAEKLAAVTGKPAPIDPPADALHAYIAAHEDAFRKRINLAFDGKDVTPEIRLRVEAADNAMQAPGAIFTLTGPVPPGAHQFTWSFAWTFTRYPLTMRTPGAESKVEWIDGGRGNSTFDLAGPVLSGSWATAWRYLTLGFTHIVPLGLDHVLFVLGIYLLSGRAKPVLLQVSAFTLAHSITLGLSMYGVVSLPSRVVEPLIALSIAYVAIENIFLSELRPWRVALVFGFGLLHGMGFAGVLQEIGLPRSEFVLALLTFNLGVEAGQLAVILAAFLLVGWRWSDKSWYRGRVVVPASVLIACLALYWTVERIRS